MEDGGGRLAQLSAASSSMPGRLAVPLWHNSYLWVVSTMPLPFFPSLTTSHRLCRDAGSRPCVTWCNSRRREVKHGAQPYLYDA